MRVGFELAGAQPHAPMRHELEKSPDELQHGAVSTLPPVVVQRSSGEAAVGVPEAPDFTGATLAAPDDALVAIAPGGSFVTGAVVGVLGALAAHAATNEAAHRVRAMDLGATPKSTAATDDRSRAIIRSRVVPRTDSTPSADGLALLSAQ